MSRTELLEQLAEKATRWRRTRVGPNTQFWDSVTDDMIAAIDALDALPAQRATAETVRVAVWANGNHYSFTHPQLRRGNEYTRLGTTTLRLDTEAAR